MRSSQKFIQYFNSYVTAGRRHNIINGYLIQFLFLTHCPYPIPFTDAWHLACRRSESPCAQWLTACSSDALAGLHWFACWVRSSSSAASISPPTSTFALTTRGYCTWLLAAGWIYNWKVSTVNINRNCGRTWSSTWKNALLLPESLIFKLLQLW